MATRRWARSPRGKIYGVVTGLAEWRDLPVEPTRLIVFLIVVCTGFFPGALIYLGLAILLPLQGEEDMGCSYSSYRSSRNMDAEDATFRDADSKSTDELRREYEELKKKVETMEGEMFDKERDWDVRFREDRGAK